MARFILTLNNKVLGSYKIAEGQALSIGRHPDNQMVIENLAVSSHHAKVTLEEGQLVLTDLDSRNGTFVNNQKVKTSTLTHQDWVTIGKYIMIVDMHESLSLDSAAQNLMALSQTEQADQTIMLDHPSVQTSYMGFDYLCFLSSVRDDYELSEKSVTIGKNPDADIRIRGIWSFLAGTPSATITKERDDYFLQAGGGRLKLKINGAEIKGLTKLNHQDIIKIGPVVMQMRRVRRPYM